jgi:hypothetical protein
VGDMATATVPVVVWSHNEKVVKSCSVSVDTTFQDVIETLGLRDIRSALVGHRNLSFKLMAGDFAPDDDYNPDGPASNIYMCGVIVESLLQQ